jgi:hypothetical protein
MLRAHPFSQTLTNQGEQTMVWEIAYGIWLAWAAFVVLGLAFYGVATIGKPTGFFMQLVANHLRRPLTHEGFGFTLWFCLAWLVIVLIV